MTKVLVAGGAGFIGSHLVARLLKRRDIARLVVVDNLWTGTTAHLPARPDARLEFRQMDVERLDAQAAFDEVYHLASPAAPARCMAEPLRTVSADVLGCFRLLAALRPGGLFCFISSPGACGETPVAPRPGSGPVDGTGPRAAHDEAKRCAETILFEARRVHGARVKVARLFNAYGPHTLPEDGRAVSNFIAQGIAGRPLTVHGDGRQTRGWAHVDDILEALERYFWLDGTDHPGPLDIGNDREAAVLDVARLVRSQFPRSEILHLPPVPQDPASRRPDLALAAELLPGWRCGVPVEEGIDRTIRWFRGLRLAGVRPARPAPREPAHLAAARLLDAVAPGTAAQPPRTARHA